jgi:hypothetical protein
VVRANFIVGEFGAARDITGECDAANRVRNVVLALESWGAAYGVFWQAYDNDATAAVYDDFGLYRRDRSMSLPGRTLKALYTTQTPTVPPSTCAAINTGGVVDGTTFKPAIHRGAVVSIFGSDFSASGNVVRLEQASRTYTVAAGSQWWFESTKQINLKLPAGVVAGTIVKVNVVGGNGLESNGQLIDVLP